MIVLISYYLRIITTKGRVFGILAAGVAAGVLGLTLRNISAGNLSVVDVLGLSGLLPVTCAIFGAAVIGDPREDGTFVYLWMRPISRAKLIVGAYVAALTLSILTTVPTLSLMVVALDGDPAAIAGVAGATVLGAVAYTGLFMFVGTLLKRALIACMVYTFIWELVIARAAKALSKISVIQYVHDVFAAASADPSLELAKSSLGVSAIVLVIIAFVAIAASRWRIARVEVD